MHLAHRRLVAAAYILAILLAPEALARFRGGAILDHAVPGVGLTVGAPVREVRLYFDIGVLAPFSRVQITNSAGAAVPVSQPMNDPSDPSALYVRLGRALGPGTYMVRWQAVSIHRRPSWGTFRFYVF
jgi:methionine-rich copper-binding protein CopC